MVILPQICIQTIFFVFKNTFTTILLFDGQLILKTLLITCHNQKRHSELSIKLCYNL